MPESAWKWLWLGSGQTEWLWHLSKSPSDQLPTRLWLEQLEVGLGSDPSPLSTPQSLPFLSARPTHSLQLAGSPAQTSADSLNFSALSA